jgi:hypothetical protein
MRRVLFGLVLVIVLLPAAAWLLLQRQARALGAPVVADAQALAARRVELAGAPEPGSVFDCLGPVADASPDLSRILPWSDPTIMAVSAGSAPWSTLNPAQQLQVDAAEGWVAGALGCGRRTSIGPTAGLGPFADVRHGRRQSMPRLMEALSTAGVLSLRRTLEAGDADLVLDRCADGLVATVGWLRLEGLEAMLPTLGASAGFRRLCGEAKGRASEAARARFQGRITAVRALAPDYAEVMRLERTQLALRLFGAWLPDDLDAQLPGDARAGTKLQRDSKWARGVLGTLALRLYWRRFDAGLREVEAACALPPVARDSAIRAAQGHLDAPLLKRFFASEPVDLRYEMYAAYLDALHAGLADLEQR